MPRKKSTGRPKAPAGIRAAASAAKKQISLTRQIDRTKASIKKTAKLVDKKKKRLTDLSSQKRKLQQTSAFKPPTYKARGIGTNPGAAARTATLMKLRDAKKAAASKPSSSKPAAKKPAAKKPKPKVITLKEQRAEAEKWAALERTKRPEFGTPRYWKDQKSGRYEKPYAGEDPSKW